MTAGRGQDLAPKGSQDIRFEEIPKGKLRTLNARKIRESYHERRQRENEEKKAKQKVAQREQGQKRSAPAVGGKSANKKAKLALDTTKDDNSDAELSQADGETGDASKLKIRPGESLFQFNRRVEEAYKVEIANAVRKVARSGRGEKRKNRAKTLREEFQRQEETFGQEGERRKVNAQAAEAREKEEKRDLKAQRDAMRLDEPERDFEAAPERRGVRRVAEAPPTLKLGKLAALAKKQAPSDTKRQQMEFERERAVQAYRLHKERQSLKHQQ